MLACPIFGLELPCSHSCFVFARQYHYTATEKIVVVIVRNEANYRSAHVWPPYAYSFTYSKTY